TPDSYPDWTVIVDTKELEKIIQQQQGQIKDLREAVEKLIAGTPKIEIHYGPTPPDNPTLGDQWFNTVTERLYCYVE
ncbi:unnamed protein product, partial [marine sediment metagenome]